MKNYTVETPSGPVLVTDDKNTAENADMAVIGLGLEFKGHAQLVVEDESQLSPQLLEQCARRFAHLPLTVAVTQRLLIREMTEEEIPLLDALDTAVHSPFTGPNEYHGLTRAQIHGTFLLYRKWAYELLGRGLYLVFRRSDGRLIGRAGFTTGDFEGTWLMLSYEIAEKERRKGYAREAAQALLDYAVNTGDREVCLLIEPANAASRALAGRLGFTSCGVIEAGEWQGKEKFLLTMSEPA